ncbi:hypothetical protein [Mycobacteroides franklinii]|uniref:Uncharacterized protein n=1 Tax=Mycobacteroides franklinii TaxID=948102 RepID=A0A4R8R260_9MYCO|nr:hypothetical protein [Mycobacteroides franklinii]TDZ43078.1 hypothetical protein CCUG64054_03129 [Mycobacteroides franklinii]TDZ50212.1 hypothetical protein CCUG63697_01714 [Mycobacteroides franklinii]TDZ56633.1 hypothetical protein CCUG63696_03131 [Mycobacteroides franklinii]TDZ63574.1 hypothetical protein CCUG63695_03056 [Mycobacteroides franklinii]TDZ69971.1 hypothetical protein CCUG64056_03129 [Mycobacteroides franklinii]
MSENSVEDVDQAELEAKLTLLQQIKASAEKTTVPSALKNLAEAYALTVGAKFGKLPGGIDVQVSK